MRRFKSLHLAMLTLGSLCLNSAYASETLHSLSDSEMSATTGQALMSLSYIAPSDTANLETHRSGGDTSVGFYKLGMEAELELNVNIKKLQLGCGGANGVGACDIDIDNFSLSGGTGGVELNPDGSVKLGVDGKPIPLTDSDTRVGSSAKLTNPFIEFAVQNPGSAALRKVVGLRLSAEGAKGLLTLGDENSGTPNGLNVLSGYMNVQSNPGVSAITGKISTKPGYLDAGKYYDIGNPLKGGLDLNLGIFGISGKATFDVTDGGFWIPGVENVPFYAPLINTAGTDGIRGIKTDGTLTDTFGKINGNRIRALQVVPNTVTLPDAVLGFNDSASTKELNNQQCGTFASPAQCNIYGQTAGFVGPDAYNYYYNPTTGYYEFVGNSTTNPDAFQSFGGCTDGTTNCSKSDPNSNYYKPGTGVVLKTQGGVRLKTGGTLLNPSSGAERNAVSAKVTSCSVIGISCSALGVPDNLGYIKMFGKITGLKANVTFEEPLGMIHSLTVDSPLYLALQDAAIQWPGAKSDDVAQKGWWLSLSDPVYVGDLLPSEAIDLCPGGVTGPISRCAYTQFINQANAYFQNNNAGGGDVCAATDVGLLGCGGKGNKKDNPLAVQISSTSGLPLDGFKLTLRDVQLATQAFAPNCYGGLKFC